MNSFTHSRLVFHGALGKRPSVFPMLRISDRSFPHHRRILAIVAGVLALAALALAVRAQVGGERGIAPIAASSDIEVTGIDVDVRGSDANDAREKAWERAVREAWAKVDGPRLPDSQLESLVSAVVIEREQIGPRRYIGRLGVIFDRARAARYLGGGAQGRPSAPILLIPVTDSAGTQLVYEQRNPWQRAWAEFQPGTSLVTYVRPSGAGGESLLINYGQISRRSRIWWRNILDQFEAGDIVVAIAKLEYSYPGGPIKARFTARYGPDNRYLDEFSMSAESSDELPAMLERAVVQFDGIFQQALRDGKLRPDAGISLGTGQADPALQRLIQIGRAVRAQEAAARAAADGGNEQPAQVVEAPAAAAVSNFVVQFATPDAASFDGALGAVRGAAGVRGASISSTAIGGTSVMSVSYAGSLDELAAALRARGFTVQQGSNALLISR